MASRGSARTGEQQRRIQREQDTRDPAAQESSPQKERKAVQAGAREQPEKLPAQHLPKPGREADLAAEAAVPGARLPRQRQARGHARRSITGGDSGIGRAVAVLFAREGADVAIALPRTSTRTPQETQRCIEAEGRRCLLIAGRRARTRRSADAAVERDRRTPSAGSTCWSTTPRSRSTPQSLEDITDERLDETLRTNIYGYFHMARAALPHLKQGASIINTGSVTGLRGSAHLLDYSATKGAIHAFTKSLAQNLLDKGIRVNAVAPGPVWTPLNPADSPAEEVAEFGSHTDMKRAGAAGGAVAGLRVPRGAGVLGLHHRHRAAGDRQRRRDLKQDPRASSAASQVVPDPTASRAPAAGGGCSTRTPRAPLRCRRTDLPAPASGASRPGARRPARRP